jgi:site-specific DNA recombinase
VWWGELCACNVRTIKEIAVREKSDERYVARILKLAFMSPKITAAILDGQQPPDMTADRMIKLSDLALLLGTAAPAPWFCLGG